VYKGGVVVKKLCNPVIKKKSPAHSIAFTGINSMLMGMLGMPWACPAWIKKIIQNPPNFIIILFNYTC